MLSALMTGADLPETLLPSRPAWMADGACAEHPEVEFIAPSPGAEANAIEARAICSRCLCRTECRAYAVANPDLLGIWGGTTTAERRELRKRSAG